MTRIGMLAPISHAYPPPGYGPWERVAHDLTEQLVAMGHDVTLFAAVGSATSARLIETIMHRSIPAAPTRDWKRNVISPSRWKPLGAGRSTSSIPISTCMG